MWSAEQAQRCPYCGSYEWEWVEDEHAWEAGAYTCLGCLSTDRERRQLQIEYGERPMALDGVHIRFYRPGGDQ